LSRVPGITRFRAAVDAIRDRRNKTVVKLVYLMACRPSEVVTRVSPADCGKTSPYGRFLTWGFQDIAGEKAFVISLTCARRKAKAEIGDRGVRRLVGLPINPAYEPWTKDLLFWMRDHDRKLSIELTQQRLGQIVRRELSELDPSISTKSLRHYRLTHLAKYYDFEPYDLIAYAGWSLRSRPVMGLFSRRMEIQAHSALRHYLPKLLRPIYEVDPSPYTRSLESETVD
jgi:hypothetical protein